jgi:hypothetical protein
LSGLNNYMKNKMSENYLKSTNDYQTFIPKKIIVDNCSKKQSGFNSIISNEQKYSKIPLKLE